MRSMILGGCLATAAAGGVYFVAAGGGSPTHCGPCVSCPAPQPAAPPESPPVVEVVDVAAELAKPAAPPEKRFVSFDEPPLAKQLSDRAKVPEVIQAAFVELAPAVEVAPMPRMIRVYGSIGLGNFWAYDRYKGVSEEFFGPAPEVAPMPRPTDPMPLAAPGDPY
jgi:hypothetical protein